MSDEQLAEFGFELCTMGGECDKCEKEVSQGEYFWKSTSCEYIEGDYYCRECATNDAEWQIAEPFLRSY